MLSLDVVSMSLERYFLFVVDCMYVYNFLFNCFSVFFFFGGGGGIQIVLRYFLILYSAVSSFWGIAKELLKDSQNCVSPQDTRQSKAKLTCRSAC